jgi:hypothetical protein
MTMEAIISRTAGRHLEAALAGWLLETRRVGRTVLRTIGDALINYSRAALLLRGGNRPLRRL